jgi:nitrite reductase (NADH) small subunit
MNAHADVWLDIGAVGDVPLRGARVVKTPKGCLAVFRVADGELYALDNRCPHEGGPLAEGIVHGRHVTCPLHNWVISLETGKVEGPDVGTVWRHPLRVEAGRILLGLAR